LFNGGLCDAERQLFNWSRRDIARFSTSASPFGQESRNAVRSTHSATVNHLFFEERGILYISSVSIRNFRCLKELDVDFSDYTALIGPNGSGKSSILYALDWFFNGQSLDDDDWTADCSDDHGSIEVAVQFDGVNEEDRAVLGKYCKGDKAYFRRSCMRGGESKIIGRALQGPGFADVREHGLNAAEVKERYSKVHASMPDLPAPGGKGANLSALDAWEADEANAPFLVAIDDADATHLFGATGTSVLASRFRMILVPAAADLAAEAEAGTRGSVLSQIVGSLTSEAVTSAQESWIANNQTELERLEAEIESKVTDAVIGPTAMVNENLQKLVPGATVVVETGGLELNFKPTADLNTTIDLDGHAAGLERQGHGVQRAMMIALLQARSQLADVGASVLFAVEEPEIYQHPVRARHFANVLKGMSDAAGSQVIVATHSPYFVDVRDLECLRRIDKLSASTAIRRSHTSEVAERAGVTEGKVQRFMGNQFGGAFAEALFSDVAILVEGPTDKAILEGIASAAGCSLPENGITVQDVGGKGELKLAYLILEDLGVPAYVMADGDGAATPINESHIKQTVDLISWLPQSEAQVGPQPTTAGDPTCVTKIWTIFHGDIEHELQTWSGFEQALNDEGGHLGDKNAYVYRAAAAMAPESEVPESLKELLNSAQDLRRSIAPANAGQ